MERNAPVFIENLITRNIKLRKRSFLFGKVEK